MRAYCASWRVDKVPVDDLYAMTAEYPAAPAAKRPKYVAFSLSEKI
jgi:hypothetical protein